jgi:inner membrane protein
MHREGHYGAALVAYAPIVFVLTALNFVTLAILGGAVVVGGAMVPDLDQRIPGIKHRGVTHTVWFALAAGVAGGICGAVFGWSYSPVAAVAMGVFGMLVGALAVVAHILADVLTPAGVRPFAPVRDDHYTVDVTRAANPIANYVLLGIGILVTAGALALGSAV